MVQPSLEKIKEQHEGLLSKSAKMTEADVPQVKAFVKSIAEAGEYIKDPDQRSFLYILIDYWSRFINNKTGKFPIIQLHSFDLSVRESGLRGKSYLRELIENPPFRSIDNDKRIKNLAAGYWVYEELLNGLARNGWVRFAPGYKGAVYGKKGSKWCIKVLGMGVGTNPLYFCECGYYLEYEREMLETFKNKGFAFQPDVKSQKETIEFLISEECGISLQQAELRVRNNDVLVTQYIGGIPFATQIGENIDCFLDISIMDEGVLGEMHTALTVLKEQLCRANSEGLRHNDIMPPNIIFTLDEEDKIVAKLIDFEVAQDLNAQSPDFVINTVRELYRERQVPMDNLGTYTKTLDQHLIDEDLALLDKLIRPSVNFGIKLWESFELSW
jgi:serine/threonine protein kinase